MQLLFVENVVDEDDVCGEKHDDPDQISNSIVNALHVLNTVIH